ncbi:MAG: M23 family metallopeptidase [Elusimicrobiales bacterium]|nr:M23 family metallopeptidase [Elusimicrobiales bacterium]
MRKALLLCAAALALAGLAAAADTGEVLQKAARDVLKQSKKGRKLLSEADTLSQKFERYRKLAHIFKKYHDSKTLDDADLLEVLKETGVIKGAKPKPGKKEPPPFPTPKYSGKYRWPMDAGVVSSEFGPRWGKQHQGLDIAADMGVPVRAIAPGEVIYSGSHLTGYGNVLIVRHDQETTTTYAHNKELRARKGDKVKQGQLIALLGSTGHSTGPHLHFEFRVGNAPVNPRTKLPKSRF